MCIRDRYYGRNQNGNYILKSFDLNTLETKTFMEDFSGYVVSSDGSKILTNKSGYRLFDVGAAGGDSKTFNIDDMYCDLNPREEWNEVFEEVWRRFRDYFYVKNMHGVDWDAIGEQLSLIHISALANFLPMARNSSIPLCSAISGTGNVMKGVGRSILSFLIEKQKSLSSCQRLRVLIATRCGAATASSLFLTATER